jgi:hypothetical protein
MATDYEQLTDYGFYLLICEAFEISLGGFVTETQFRGIFGMFWSAEPTVDAITLERPSGSCFYFSKLRMHIRLGLTSSSASIEL